MRSVALALTVLLATAVLPSHAEEFIVESRATGKNFDRYKELEGRWNDSSGKSRAPDVTDWNVCGSRKTVFAGEEDARILSAANAAARFLPKFEKPAHYYVYVTWGREGNGGPVTYTVRHANGSESKQLTQNGWGVGGRSNANIWHSLGDYDFVSGNEQYVELRMNVSEVKVVDKRNMGQIFADAVMFSPTALEDTGSVSLPTATTSRAPAARTTPRVRLAPDAKLEWESTIPAATAAAQRSGKKILLFFYSPGTQTTRHYDTTVFTDPGVKSILSSDYELVRIDFIKNTDMAFGLMAFKAGTIIVYDNTGIALKKIDPRVSAAELVKQLQGL